jgi:hypothetical protein
MTRRFQFSLRVLLVGTAILALWLGWHVERARRQREAARLVNKLGGFAHYDHWGKPGWSILRKCLGDEFSHSIVYVSLTRAHLADDDLRELLSKLADVGTIHTLVLSGTELTDSGIVGLASLTDLRDLWIDDTGITDDGLESLSGLRRLQNLNLGQTRITDGGLRHIHGVSSLLAVNLYQTGVTELGVKRLQNALPNTETVMWEGRFSPRSPSFKRRTNATPAH